MRKRIKEFIPEVRDVYTVSDEGFVYSDNIGGRALKFRDNKGYKKVVLYYDDGRHKEYSIHRLVMMAFKPIENCENFEVNHIDGHKDNNNLFNLEWCTAAENQRHAYRMGLNHLSNQYGENNYQAKLTQDDVNKIFELRSQGWTQQAISELFPVSRRHIGKILEGKRWIKKQV